MDSGDVLITLVLGLLVGGQGALIWTRLNRIEAALADKVDRHELKSFRAEVRQGFAEVRQSFAEVRQEVADLRAEVRDEVADLRREISSLHSDLLKVALAVGAERPRAQEA